jgi:hypothetical protein
VPGAGRSGHLLALGIAQLVSTAWPIAFLRWSLGASLAWPGYRLWQKPGVSNLLLSAKSTQAWAPGSSDNPIMSPPALLTRYGVIIFRVVSAPAGLFFVVAVVLMASGASLP